MFHVGEEKKGSHENAEKKKKGARRKVYIKQWLYAVWMWGASKANQYFMWELFLAQGIHNSILCQHSFIVPPDFRLVSAATELIFTAKRVFWLSVVRDEMDNRCERFNYVDKNIQLAVISCLSRGACVVGVTLLVTYGKVLTIESHTKRMLLLSEPNEAAGSARSVRLYIFEASGFVRD